MRMVRTGSRASSSRSEKPWQPPWISVANPGSQGFRTSSAVRLLGICVVAGVIVAGATFPVLGGIGALTLASGSSVSASSPELERGALPATRLPILDPAAGFSIDGFHASAAGYAAWAEPAAAGSGGELTERSTKGTQTAAKLSRQSAK